MTFGVPTAHQGRPLNCANASILDMAVAKSWNEETAGKQLRKACADVGHDPLYVISDNASILK
ncbi:hypothetical protein A8C56_04125 [Niabella ginsenosidivorans]|uniref:Uncharacterized protein n=1 Tax=Niabella ginsenosidivorans TaxID=1176587 RepID=A0A1A9HXX2_9BACT|nr:hypothetical protein [Niabella ginsenosidivorans]ANH80278.1 hypothetical protein A8C56_04125 [Niabella ginsenosidivorans]